MKNALLIFIALVCLTACNSHSDKKTAWTKEYENKLYKQIDDAAKPRIPDENKRSELVVYTLKRLKQALPNGLESVSNDSLQSISAKIGADYSSTHKYAAIGVRSFVKWTPKVEQAIKEYILRDKPKDGDKLYNCVLLKIKKAYPDSLAVPFDRDLLLKFAKECSSGAN
ncbi:hypothetical protein HK413_00695 [Mucilaginibacter sp. S1162]|uniref:Lipoprotein n=1 Tax=Mucilaginibacter humi TaxID=2732510 RepID=A0ABX1W468_9SPHI|nr:hypothetical protein [Mucilaginibacter humi]NNU33075.1 hypothetical protein [Mucilaginibacter humi]